MKALRRGLPFFAMILAALTATVTSAYYTDMIQEEGLLVQSADISFGDERGQISANTEDFYERLVPLKEGEGFDVSFSAPYKGNTVSYVVPRLELKADGFEDGDTVMVTDGVSEAYMYSASGVIYSLPAEVSPGETVTKKYHITIVKKTGSNPITFSYNFTFAAVQKTGNEKLYEDSRSDGSRLYEAVKKGTEIKGFSELTSADDVAEGDEALTEMKYYKLTVEPQITEGFGNVSACRWFVCPDSEKNDARQVSSDRRLMLVLNKRNIGAGLRLWLEAENEAGCVTSSQYSIKLSDGKITVKREV